MSFTSARPVTTAAFTALRAERYSARAFGSRHAVKAKPSNAWRCMFAHVVTFDDFHARTKPFAVAPSAVRCTALISQLRFVNWRTSRQFGNWIPSDTCHGCTAAGISKFPTLIRLLSGVV